MAKRRSSSQTKHSQPPSLFGDSPDESPGLFPAGGTGTEPPREAVETDSKAGPLAAPPKNLVQQASAGTGKTFALSNRFLMLVVGGAAPDSILASTFTRKGAGEILDRIISRLGAAATSEPAAAKLGQELQHSFNRGAAITLLRRMVDALPSLQVGTLDSFFNRIARAFCFELGLPPDWTVVDPLRVRGLHDQAIETILGEEATPQLLRLMSKAEADRRVADLIAKTVDALFVIYRDSTAEAWEQFGSPHPVSATEVEEVASGLENLQKLPSRIAEHTMKLAGALRAGTWEDAAEMGLVQKVRNGETHYYRQEIPTNARELVAQADSLIRRQVSWLVDSRTKATRDLLARFDAALQPLQLATGELEFADVTFHLARSIQLNPKEIADRLGHRTEHLLLDEFQDTSPQQWAVIKPLAEHVLQPNSGRTFFCVGDRKQAIYGWRGGESRIFDAVLGGFQDRVTEAEPLVESYRSSDAILQMVNSVFGQFGALANSEDDSATRTVLASWGREFHAHRSAKPDLPGYAEVRQLAEQPDLDTETLVLLETAAEVKRLHEQYPGKEIAVLLRGNAPIARLAHLLQREGIATSEEAGNPLTDAASVEVVLSAMTLADHPGDGVARFHISHSPLGAAFGLQPESAANQAANAGKSHRVAAEIRDQLLKAGYGPTVRNWARILGSESTTEREAQRMEQLVEIAYSYDSTWTLRPQRFVDYVREQRVSDRTGARVRLMTMHAAKGLGFDIVVAPLTKKSSGWTSSPPQVVVGRSDPAGPIDAVSRFVRGGDLPLLPARIQGVFEEYQVQRINEELCLLYVTLTRAKQHLTVLVPPQAAAKWKNETGVLLRALGAARAEATEDGVLGSWGTRDWLERASSPADEAVPSPSNSVKAAPEMAPRPAQLLAAGNRMGRGQEWLSPSSLHSRSGSTQAYTEAGSKRERHARSFTDNSPQNLGNAFSGQDSLRDANPELSTELAKRDLISTVERTQLSEARPVARQRGSAWHLLLQEIVWQEVVPDRASLLVTLGSLLAEPQEREELVDEFLGRLAAGEFAPWLSEPVVRSQVLKRHYPNGKTLLEPLRLDVKRELPFVFQQRGTWYDGVIDRIVLVSEGDRLVGAELLDFKSGRVSAASLTREVERYRQQMQLYSTAIEQLFGLGPESIFASLLFTAVTNEDGTIVCREVLLSPEP